ncbi:MAG: chlorophyll a/b-binding protein [Cyanobacteriota bacterium]|nr:chlorophyll a/b-binding protein [Cyanobacteriota bacterium]
MSSPPATASSTPAPGAPAEPSAPPATSATTRDTPAFGWSAYAERVNGRFAMLGFASVLLIEWLSHDTFLHWAGLVP